LSSSQSSSSSASSPPCPLNSETETNELTLGSRSPTLDAPKAQRRIDLTTSTRVHELLADVVPVTKQQRKGKANASRPQTSTPTSVIPREPDCLPRATLPVAAIVLDRIDERRLAPISSHGVRNSASRSAVPSRRPFGVVARSTSSRSAGLLAPSPNSSAASAVLPVADRPAPTLASVPAAGCLPAANAVALLPVPGSVAPLVEAPNSVPSLAASSVASLSASEPVAPAPAYMPQSGNSTSGDTLASVSRKRHGDQPEPNANPAKANRKRGKQPVLSQPVSVSPSAGSVASAVVGSLNPAPPDDFIAEAGAAIVVAPLATSGSVLPVAAHASAASPVVARAAPIPGASGANAASAARKRKAPSVEPKGIAAKTNKKPGSSVSEPDNLRPCRKRKAPGHLRDL